MKKANHTSGLGFAGALLLCAVVCLWTALPAAAQTGDEYCELSLNSCPAGYDGDTIKVPLRVVSLSAKIRPCATTITDSIKGGDPPAIMFIIDHSTSMTNTGECNGNPAGCDPIGNRFRVTRALIDSINAAFPAAEVGITVFSNGLVLDSDRDENLVRFAGVDVSDTFGVRQSYMPLKPLNANAKTGGTNPYAGDKEAPKIIDVYQGMFTPPATGNNWRLSGRAEVQGTNISLAFAAALEAFKHTSIPKKDQYIIFLSDGAPGLNQSKGGGPCTGHEWCGRENEFADGDNTPTTYTVFLRGNNAVNPTAPAILRTMTDNINANNYDVDKRQSNLWAIGSGYDALLALMMENIFKDILTQTQSNARRIVVESAGITDSTDAGADSTFGFGRMLPIDTGTIAPVKMGIYYMVRVDTSVDIGSGVLKDTVIRREEKFDYTFWIKRTNNAADTANWEESQGVSAKCGTKPGLALLYNNNEISTIQFNMTKLTVRFDKAPGGFDFTYNKDNVNIEIATTQNQPWDTLWTKAIQQSSPSDFREDANYLYWTFTLDAAAPDPSTSNIKLEFNGVSDSIILFFKNPYIPLDTIRVGIPYVSYRLEFSKGRNNASPDMIIPSLYEAKAGETLDIYTLLSGVYGLDSDMLDAGNVVWKLDKPSNGDGVLTPDASLSSHAAFGATKTTPGEDYYTVTATFTADASRNNLVITSSFKIKVVPGDAAYLEVVFADPNKTAPPAHVDVSTFAKNKSLEMSKGANDTTLYVIARDEFGNYIERPVSGSWTQENDAVRFPSGNSGPSAKVERVSESFGVGKITVTEGGLSVTIDVTVVGDGSVAIGPNPFVPGVDDAKRRLEQSPYWQEARVYYEKILDNGAVGGAVGTNRQQPGDTKGILVAGIAPRKILTEKNGRDPKATIIIYDAVGNIVFKSKPNEITLVDENNVNAFGFVWNGKNNKGRTVAPGTYLVRMHADLGEGNKYVQQKKIGVTKHKK